MLGETGDWDGALSRITTMINGGQDPVEGLAHGFASGGLVEAYARQIEAEYGVELGMALPTLLGALSGATQGGFEAPMLHDLTQGGHDLYTWTPLVVQFIGIAEAGQSKSTVLKEVNGSLRFALDRKGLDHRRQLVADARAQAVKAHEAQVGGDFDKEVVGAVYSGGLCPSSVTDSGTQEGIKKALATNGGHRMILTAEPDVLGEISQYQGKGKSGSLGLMLRGWGQEDLDSDRVSDPQSAREPSLPFVILTQPESFTEFTGGGEVRDRFVDRGVFSRTLLCKAERTPVVDKFEAWMSVLDGELAPVDTAMATPLGAMREQMQAAMDRLVERTNAYRVSKGIESAWKNAVAKYEWLQRPTEIKRQRLAIYDKSDPAARKAALLVMLKMQRLRAQLRGAVAAAEAHNPGIAQLLDPLALRYVDHTMRIASLMSLADDPDAVSIDVGYMEDVATRVMPWLWANWWKVMADRLEESGRVFVETQTLKNPKGVELSGGPKLLRAMVNLENGAGLAAAEGFLPSAIFKIASNWMPTRSGNNPYFRVELKRIEAEGLVEVVPGSATTNASHTVSTARYRLTAAGRAKVGASV